MSNFRKFWVCYTAYLRQIWPSTEAAYNAQNEVETGPTMLKKRNSDLFEREILKLVRVLSKSNWALQAYIEGEKTIGVDKLAAYVVEGD